MLTMHRAKGLSADVVFIVGAEKQIIPGRNVGEKEGDERRLLYVSLTRAKHKLFITYCQKRTKKSRQAYTGSDSGKMKRDLTPFLQDTGLPVEHM